LSINHSGVQGIADKYKIEKFVYPFLASVAYKLNGNHFCFSSNVNIISLDFSFTFSTPKSREAPMKNFFFFLSRWTETTQMEMVQLTLRSLLK